jgi:hypothetical protein
VRLARTHRQGVIDDMHHTDVDSTDPVRASIRPFTLKLNHVGMSDLGTSAGSQWPFCPDPATGLYDPRFVTMLVRNYRSHTAIIKLPSDMFYHGRLEPHANREEVQSLCGWQGGAACTRFDRVWLQQLEQNI